MDLARSFCSFVGWYRTTFLVGNLAAALLGLVFWNVILHGVKKKKRQREQ
jgi:hypothetical protein